MSYHNPRRGNSRGRYTHPRSNDHSDQPSLTDEESRLVKQGKEDLFDKRKDFPLVTSLKENSLLSHENLFKADRWTIEKLIAMKAELTNTRNRLNEKDIKVWKEHTYKTNMTGRIVWPLRNQNRIEMCTNAWLKMAEIHSKFKNLIPEGNTRQR